MPTSKSGMLTNPLIRGVAYAIYVFLHLALPLYTFVRWRLVPMVVRHLMHYLVHGSDGINLAAVVQTSRKLGKVPEHIVFVFDERDHQLGSPYALGRISALTSWALAAGIPYISIFDSKGTLKAHGKDLLTTIESSSFFRGSLKRLPVVPEGSQEKQCCSPCKEGGCTDADINEPGNVFFLRCEDCHKHSYLEKNGTESCTFCIKLLSAEDGRTDIINAIKKLSREDIKPTDIDVSNFQKALAGFGGLPDPNLMLKFDGTSVMPEFPPWQMSLTEILDVGTLQDATWPNFLNCLQWYSRSVQRFGK